MVSQVKGHLSHQDVLSQLAQQVPISIATLRGEEEKVHGAQLEKVVSHPGHPSKVVSHQAHLEKVTHQVPAHLEKVVSHQVPAHLEKVVSHHVPAHLEKVVTHQVPHGQLMSAQNMVLQRPPAAYFWMQQQLPHQ